VAMPNGFLIGWTDNDLYLSEAYHPHAWPPEYVVSTEYPVVGLGVFGSTCVICTQGYPSSLSGVKPATTSLIKSNTNEPCLSRGSIVSTPDGVYYASQNGLMAVTPAGFQNITRELITREDWIRKFSPQFLRAARYQNGYLALRAVPNATQRSGFFLDPTALKVALTEFSELDTAVNIHGDVWSGEVFLLDDEQVWQWDPPTDDMWPVWWTSKEFQFPRKVNMGCYAVYWDEARFSPNDYGTDILPSDVHVRFRVFADRRLVYDQTVPHNGMPIKLPSGFKSDIWQFEVRARAPVYSVHIASTTKELRNV